MDRLTLIRLFVEVARARSFTAASKRVGLSRASVTKQVAMLEQSMAVRLFNRTTQHVALTEAGELLLDQGLELLDDFDRIQAQVRDAQNEPTGIIRVGTPPAFGDAHLVPAIVAFTQAHPNMRIDLHLDDSSADLVRDGLDISLRIGPTLKSASHIARVLIKVPQVLVASQMYLQRHGKPTALTDLKHHNCLIHRINSPSNTWRFGSGADRLTLQVTGSISSNFGEVLRSAALQGAGISQHALYMVNDEIEAGRLEIVLPGVKCSELTISAIYPRRNPPVRVKAFIEFLREWFPQKARWLHVQATYLPAPES